MAALLDFIRNKMAALLDFNKNKIEVVYQLAATLIQTNKQ